MHLRLSLTLGIIALSLVGCARFGVSNSSLDYKKTQTLQPLKVPDNMVMRPQQSLYPAPKVDPRAVEQAPNFENKYGNRYELPRPQAVQGAALAVTGSAPSKPQVVVDGNGIPLIKIDGSADQVWKYVVAASSAANLKYTDGRSSNQINVEYQDAIYQVRLTSTGSSNTLGVYNTQNNFVDAKIANEILTLIYQNWPA